MPSSFVLCGDVCEAQALCIAIAADGRVTILGGFLNGFICAWDADSHILRARWQAHTIGVTSIVSCGPGEVWSHGRDGWAYRWRLDVEPCAAASSAPAAMEPIVPRRHHVVCIGYGSLCRLSAVDAHPLDATVADKEAVDWPEHHQLLACTAMQAEKIEIWECSGASELSEAAVEAARRGTGDPSANASGARLLASLEPPVKPKDAYWGGSGSSAADDDDAKGDPKGALEKILKGKSGMAMCVQLLLASQHLNSRCTACVRASAKDTSSAFAATAASDKSSGATAAAWEPPPDEDGIHSLKDLFAKRPPAREGGSAGSALIGGTSCSCSCGSVAVGEVLVAAGYENGHVYILDSGLERSDTATVRDGDSVAAARDRYHDDAAAVAGAKGRREPSVVSAGDDDDDHGGDEELFLSRMGRAAGAACSSAVAASGAGASRPAVAASAFRVRGLGRRRLAVGRFRSRTATAAAAGGAGAARPLHADAPSSASNSKALVSLQIGRQPVLALAISSDCRRGVAGSAEATVAVFSLDIPAGTAALLHRVPLPLAGTSAACVLAAAPVMPTDALHTGLWGARTAPSAPADVGVTAGWDGTVRLVQLSASAEGYSDAAASVDAASAGLVTALRNAHGSTAYGAAAWPTPLRSVLSDAAGVAGTATPKGAAPGGAAPDESKGNDELDDLLADGPFGGSPVRETPAETALLASSTPCVAGMIATAAKDGTITVYRL